MAELPMTTLTVRDVDPPLAKGRRMRAARNGRSMEAELRQTPSGKLGREKGQELNLADAIRQRFGPLGGVELEPHPPVPTRKPPYLGTLAERKS